MPIDIDSAESQREPDELEKDSKERESSAVEPPLDSARETETRKVDPAPVSADKPSTTNFSRSRKFRLHRFWPGENRICCWGWLMTGAPTHECTSGGCLRSCCAGGDGKWSKACEWTIEQVEKNDSLNKPICTAMSCPNICAWTFILTPSIIYFKVAMPYFWVKLHFVVPLIGLFFFVLTVAFLLSACFSDPGIIPRREVILAEGSAERLEQELGFAVLGVPDPKASVRSDGTVRHVVPDDMHALGYRWCSTCNIVRPPRASHCVECDNCVLRFDHHCPFINNCVGQRNYLFFFGFTTSVCCLAVTVLPLLFWYFVISLGEDKTDTSEVEVDDDGLLKGVLITVAVAGGLLALLVMVLWVYHVFLICSGLTTKEHWRGRRTPAHLAGQEELTIFARRGPRLFELRSWVEAVKLSADGSRAPWRLNAEPQSKV